MTARNEEKIVVAAMAGIDPDRVKGYVLVVDDGTRQATVITNLPVGKAGGLLFRITDLVLTGRATENLRHCGACLKPAVTGADGLWEHADPADARACSVEHGTPLLVTED